MCTIGRYAYNILVLRPDLPHTPVSFYVLSSFKCCALTYKRVYIHDHNFEQAIGTLMLVVNMYVSLHIMVAIAYLLFCLSYRLANQFTIYVLTFISSSLMIAITVTATTVTCPTRL